MERQQHIYLTPYLAVQLKDTSNNITVIQLAQNKVQRFSWARMDYVCRLAKKKPMTAFQ